MWSIFQILLMYGCRNARSTSGLLQHLMSLTLILIRGCFEPPISVFSSSVRLADEMLLSNLRGANWRESGMTEHHSAPEIVDAVITTMDWKRIALVDDYGQKIAESAYGSASPLGASPARTCVASLN